MTIIFCIRANTHRFLKLNLPGWGIIVLASVCFVVASGIFFVSGGVVASAVQERERLQRPPDGERKLELIRDRFQRVWQVDRAAAAALTKRIGTLNGRMRTFIAKAESLTEPAQAYRDPTKDRGFQTLDWVFEPIVTSQDDGSPYRLPDISIAPRETSELVSRR